MGRRMQAHEELRRPQLVRLTGEMQSEIFATIASRTLDILRNDSRGRRQDNSGQLTAGIVTELTLQDPRIPFF